VRSCVTSSRPRDCCAGSGRGQGVPAKDGRAPRGSRRLGERAFPRGPNAGRRAARRWSRRGGGSGFPAASVSITLRARCRYSSCSPLNRSGATASSPTARAAHRRRGRGRSSRRLGRPTHRGHRPTPLSSSAIAPYPRLPDGRVVLPRRLPDAAVESLLAIHDRWSDPCGNRSTHAQANPTRTPTVRPHDQPLPALRGHARPLGGPDRLALLQPPAWPLNRRPRRRDVRAR
jgi:hypothetical protein